MCARSRTVDEPLPFNNSDRTSSSSDVAQTGNDANSSCMTSSGEFPVALRPRRRGIPVAWRSSLPSTITPSIAATTAIRRPITNTVPTPVSISGHYNEPVSDVGRCRPLCKYITSGSRNVTESGPVVRPTCMRYSYWLTFDDRLCVSKYSTLTPRKFSGYEDHPRRHFRPRSCEIINVGREPAVCRVVSPRSDDDNESVLQVRRTCSHVTGSSTAGQVISTNTSAFDGGTDCGGHSHTTHSTNRTCPAVCLNPDDDHDGRTDAGVNNVSDVNVDRSVDAVERERRLSLSKIGDSGLGTSMHSQLASPDETALPGHHHDVAQQQLRQRLSDDDDDDDTNDVSECRRQGHVQRQFDDDDGDDDDRTKLTRHKCEYR